MEIKVGDTVERVGGSHMDMTVGDTATVDCVLGYGFINLKEFEGQHKGSFFKVVSSQEETTRHTKKTVADDEQDGEKWTHEYMGDKCRVLVSAPDSCGFIVVERDSGEYSMLYEDSIKPIKPTLTKAQAWDYAVASGLCTEEVENKYDITD